MNNQRWRDRRDSYRPAGETIDTSRYEVAEIDKDSEAKGFVERHHYSGCYPAARERFGLYTAGQLVGVAVFSHPCNDLVLTGTFIGLDRMAAVELGRFVLLDSVPGNGETWFLARCFEGLRRKGLSGVVSYSDPESRTTAEGTVIFGGHVGTIYQAANAVYLGRATARTLRILPTGAVLSARAISKLRTKTKGWQYAAELLVIHGAEAPHGDLREWASHWVPRLTRPMRHQGNHKYAWGLDKATRRLLPESKDYPKLRAKHVPIPL